MVVVGELINDLCGPEPKIVAAALQAAQGRGRELGPALVAQLERILADPAAGTREAPDAPFLGFLFYLAAEFRLAAAHPLICRLLRLGEDRADRLVGDAVTGAGGPILADTFDGSTASIFGLVEDRSAGPFERGAGLFALAILVRRGEFPREEMLALMVKLAASLDPKREPDCMVANHLVDAAVQLHAHEIRGTIMDLYSRDLAEETYFESDYTGPALEPDARPAREAEQLDRRIDNAWESVKQWYFFSEDFLRPDRVHPTPTNDDAFVEPLDPPAAFTLDDSLTSGSPAVPYRAPPKVGRNDPCPCGSGRKFKKCCGR